MKWTTATATLLAAGCVLLVADALLTPERATPAEILADVTERRRDPAYDVPLALRDLTRAIEDSRSATDPELLTGLLTTRAEVYAELENYASARADYETLVTVHGHDDPHLVLRAVELEALEGQVESAWAKVRDLLKAEPELPAGWRIAGQLERRLAAGKVSEAIRAAEMALVREDARRATALAVELSARDPADPVRLQLATELRSLLLPRFRDELKEVLDLSDEASAFHARARGSFARSFVGGADETAVREFIEMLRQAGHGSLAAEFGTAVRAIPEIESSEPVFDVLLDALSELGQHELAFSLVQSWPWKDRGGSRSLCEKALRAVFELGRWPALGAPATELRNLATPTAENLSLFYTGLMFVGLERWQTAVAWLQRYVNSGPEYVVEPFTGALAFAHWQLSRAYAGLKKADDEREHLLRALTPPRNAVPEEWLSRIGSEAYLRCVQLLLLEKNAGYRKPEELHTVAMSMAPERTGELFDAWRTLGELAMEREGHDLDTILDNMRTQGSIVPTIQVGPWATYRVAEMHLERGNVSAAMIVARRLLKDYPGLLPARDIVIEAQLRRGSRLQVIEEILERVRLVGADERTIEFLARIDPSTMSSAQRHELMLLDPRGEGRRRVAEHLLATGQPERALQALTIALPKAPKEKARGGNAGKKPAKGKGGGKGGDTGATDTGEAEGDGDAGSDVALAEDDAGEEPADLPAPDAEPGDPDPDPETETETEPLDAEVADGGDAPEEAREPGEGGEGGELEAPEPAPEEPTEEVSEAAADGPEEAVDVEVAGAAETAGDGQDERTEEPAEGEPPGASDAGTAKAWVRKTPELPVLRVLRARALEELGRHADALVELDGLLEDDLVRDDALSVLVAAHLRSGEPEGLDALVQVLGAELAREGTAAKQLALHAVDELLARGELDRAGALLATLDSRVETRGGDVLQRLALRAALANDREGALTALERAEAFVEDGQIELARLLFAIEDRDWTRLPRLVGDLRATTFAPDELQDAILALLEERLEAGAQMARTGLDANPLSPGWALAYAAAQLLTDEAIELPAAHGADAADQIRATLRGREGRSRDPREVLALVLAPQARGWALWALPRVLELPQKGGGELWPAAVAAGLHVRLGDVDAALARYGELVTTFPHFAPGWEGLDAVTRSRVSDPWAKEVLAVRVRRAKVLGESGVRGPVEKALDSCAERLLAGDTKNAAKVLATALAEQEGRTHQGRAFLARIYAALGEYKLATAEYELALSEERRASDSALVGEYVDVLGQAWQPKVKRRARVAVARVAAALEELELRFQRDPLIPLERARLGMARETRTPALGVEMVENVFQRFRQRTGEAPLDSLRPGSARRWGELLLAVSPKLAESLARSDLAATPGNVDLWDLLALAHEAQGNDAEALRVREALVAMSNDPLAHYEYAWLLVRTGGESSEITRELYLADHSPYGGREIRTRTRFLRGIAQLRTGGEVTAVLVRDLEQLWSGRRTPDIDHVLLGRSLAQALLLRHGEKDLEKLQKVLQQLDKLPQADAYTRDLVRAYAGMLEQVAPALEEDAGAGADEVQEEPSEGQKGKQPGGGGKTAGKRPAGQGAGKGAGKKPTAKAPAEDEPDAEDVAAEPATEEPPDDAPPAKETVGAPPSDLQALPEEPAATEPAPKKKPPARKAPPKKKPADDAPAAKKPAGKDAPAKKPPPKKPPAKKKDESLE